MSSELLGHEDWVLASVPLKAEAGASEGAAVEQVAARFHTKSCVERLSAVQLLGVDTVPILVRAMPRETLLCRLCI